MAFNCYMHPRNIYRVRPDFKQLASEFPEFCEYAIYDERGRVHVNFKDASTLRCLTKTLLKKDFGLNVSIPENCLIPTVPQRLNYILWIEDLLNVLPSTGETVKGIDIGTGPCCIFSVLGAKKNGWKFFATESEEESIKWATKNVFENGLQEQIEICRVDKQVILKGAVNDERTFDFCMCNPPFFNDLDELFQRKKSGTEGEADDLKAKQNEVMVQGGEVEFIRKMIRDSMELKEKIRIYTSMFGKKKSQVEIKNYLKNLGVNYTLTEFCQGNTLRWGVAWTFVKGVDLSRIHCSKRKKKKKPLNFLIKKSPEGYSIKGMLQKVVSILQELSIQYEIRTETRLNVVLLIQSNENTWSHQRRKRRQAQQLLAKMDGCASSESKSIPYNSEASVSTHESTENIYHSFATDQGRDVSGIDVGTEFSEGPLQMEMDPEVSLEKDHDLSAGSVAEDMETEVAPGDTMLLSEKLIPDPSSGENDNQLPSSNVTEVFHTGFGVNTSGNLDTGFKRKHESEDMADDSMKKAKSAAGESQSTHSESGIVPLLLCDLELKRHCDKIMLEMSCEEHCNRLSMSEILQLFKNRLT